MNCIFCDIENKAKAREHIVSQSFGNEHYVMQKGDVCDECNNKFSKFESTAIGSGRFNCNDLIPRPLLPGRRGA